MWYELVTFRDLHFGIGPNYNPFIEDLHLIAQKHAGRLRVALVAIALSDGRTAFGAGLLDAKTTDAIRTEAKAAIKDYQP